MSTLARLSFWMPPEQMDAFEAAYKKKIVPILKKHDLEASSERGRRPVEGIFSRLFEVETPSEVVVKERALGNDPAWQELLQSLGMVFDSTSPDSPIRSRFGVYVSPAGSGRSVKAGVGTRQGLWETLDVLDGLPSPRVHDILQDREGNLWFGSTGTGVSRYDGEQFLIFTVEDGLASNDVRCILEDQKGHLWFGTLGGVSRYDGSAFVTFTTEDGLTDDHVRAVLEDRDGNLWFGTGAYDEDVGEGVNRYDGSAFVTFTTEDGLASNNAVSLCEDHEGNIWIGTWGGVSRYDGEEFLTFTRRDGLADNGVTSILEDRERNLWFGTGPFRAGDGVTRYDGNEFVTFAGKDGLAGDFVMSILEDREGDLWFGTNEGVNRYDGDEFVTFTPRDGMAGGGVLSILEDREGHLWFGTWGGVSRYSGGRITVFTQEDGLVYNGVSSILEDREGNLWFGALDGGVSRYDGSVFDTFTIRDGLADNRVWSIVQDREGDLWFATQGGVSRYDGSTFISFTTRDGLAHNTVHSVFEDREGNLWFGTLDGGVSRYDGSTFDTFTTKDGLADNHVWDILQDREGDLWFATGGGGVSRYDGSTFISFTTTDGLADDGVHSLLEDREGNLWFGTYGGPDQYDGEQFARFTIEGGLTGDRVMSMLEDREGNLWFGTLGGGVSRYDGRVLQDLGRQDGLANNMVQEIIQDRNGDFWIATEGGVVRYRLCHTPPRVRITEVVADRRYGPVEEIRVPAYRKYVIAFEFQGRSLYTHWDRMAYVYMLEGYDSDWQTTHTHRMEYQDLPVGEYTFQVKAVDRDLNYSEPATVRVIVEPDPRLEGLAEALSGTSEEFVGASDALRRVEEQLVEVASTDVTVLILGETGTGKGLAARTIHELSVRKIGPFITITCGGIPAGLVESELFGHERGAFTGAISRKLGKVELAEGSTLFLDEIGDLSLEAQSKLLQFLEERTFERVGGTETLHADVRVIAATNRDLRAMVETGRFREDLYFRIQEYVVELPPLRERRDDIAVLAHYFMERMASHLDKEVTDLTPEALGVLESYAWPGNVRELEHTVNRAVIRCRGSGIRAEEIALEFSSTGEETTEYALTPEAYERQYIQRVLEQTGWVIKGPDGAAAVLGLPASTLRSRMKKLGIVRG